MAYWTDGDQQTIFHNVSDGRLLALDAATGRRVWRGAGYVDLSRDIDWPGADMRAISTPIVSNDVVVAQVWHYQLIPARALTRPVLLEEPSAVAPRPLCQSWHRGLDLHARVSVPADRDRLERIAVAPSASGRA